MALTHSIFKNKPIPTEVPIQPPAVKHSEINNPDADQKIIDAFNQLHITMSPKINAFIRNTLQFDEDSPKIPLALIAIILDYYNRAAEREEYRLKGVSDIPPGKLLVLSNEDSYPLILTHQANGLPQAGITTHSKYYVTSTLELQNVDVKYEIFATTRYRTVHTIAETKILRNAHTGALYGEGIHVIDTASPFMLSDFNQLTPPHAEAYFVFGASSGKPTYLHFLSIPPGKVADIAIGSHAYNWLFPDEGTLSYTIASSEFCPFRAFYCGANFFTVRIKKTYDQKPSAFSIASLFCCRRRRSTDVLSESKQEEKNFKLS